MVERSSGGERTLIAPVLFCISIVLIAGIYSAGQPLTIVLDYAWYKMLWDSSERSSLRVGQHRFREDCKARRAGGSLVLS